jgi:hypothetical protein
VIGWNCIGCNHLCLGKKGTSQRVEINSLLWCAHAGWHRRQVWTFVSMVNGAAGNNGKICLDDP